MAASVIIDTGDPVAVPKSSGCLGHSNLVYTGIILFTPGNVGAAVKTVINSMRR